jgi:hypothetical protein
VRSGPDARELDITCRSSAASGPVATGECSFSARVDRVQSRHVERPVELPMENQGRNAKEPRGHRGLVRAERASRRFGEGRQRLACLTAREVHSKRMTSVTRSRRVAQW